MSSVFRCKQFNVEHGDGVFKVNTDALLLAIYAPIVKGKVLDVGTGSGFVSLAYAQRALDSKITGIDIHPESIEMATKNFASSPWKERLDASLDDILAFNPSFKFDLILSNPPYHLESSVANEEDSKRAKFVSDLTPEKLAERIDVLLSLNGMAAVIGSSEYIARFANKTKKLNLNIAQTVLLKGKVKKPAKRVILIIQRNPTVEKSLDLVMYNNDNSYSKVYTDLVDEYLFL